MVNGSNLMFTSTESSNSSLFEIRDSHLNVNGNNTDTNVTIEYTFTYNNFSTVKSENIFLSKIFVYKYFE